MIDNQQNVGFDSYNTSSPVSTSESRRMDGQARDALGSTLKRALYEFGRTGEALQSICDVGSGYGALVPLLCESLTRSAFDSIVYRPIDCNERLLEIAAARARRAGFSVEPTVGLLDKPLSGPDWTGRADLTVASFVLTHVADLDIAVSNLAALTRIGGLVVIVDTDYLRMSVFDNGHLHDTLASIQSRLNVRLEGLDVAAARANLIPMAGSETVIEAFGRFAGPDPRASLDFVDGFAANDPARISFIQAAATGFVVKPRIRRIFRRLP